VALLSVAGLIAGLINVVLVYPFGRLSFSYPDSDLYIFGAPLGITLAVSLAMARTVAWTWGFL
jgi:hypothetical protein